MPVTLSAQGTEIAYTVAGTGPPDLIFLHGWAGSAAYFRESLDSLDLDRARAIAVDLSGHGESPPVERTWSLDDIDDAVLAAADAARARRFIAVGYSMGAKFALHLAVAHPERVSALVLVSGTPAAAIPMPPELLDDWYSRAGNVGAMRDLLTPFLTGPVDEAAAERFAENAARVPRSALEGTMRATVETDFEASLASIDVPTLVLGGALDTLFTPELLRATLVDRIAGARLVLLDCGHEIPLERPREFTALLEAFLAGLHELGEGHVQLIRTEVSGQPAQATVVRGMTRNIEG